MNNSYKVIWSKARQALMVVNEATSSVQAKGTKTVVAVALSLAAASAMSATLSDITIGSSSTSQTIFDDSFNITDTGSGQLTLLLRNPREPASTTAWQYTLQTGNITLDNGATIYLDGETKVYNNRDYYVTYTLYGNLNLTNSTITHDDEVSEISFGFIGNSSQLVENYSWDYYVSNSTIGSSSLSALISFEGCKTTTITNGSVINGSEVDIWGLL